jgi:malonyl CoA-acyl carrier protein transacylase
LLGELGVKLFVEAGPGHVLTRLVTRNLPGVRAVAVGNTGLSGTMLLVERAGNNEPSMTGAEGRVNP